MNAETQTAKDFTMISYNCDPSYNPGGAFGYMVDAIDPQDIQNEGVENWVRAYVRGTIAGWNQTRATDETVYRTWRSNGEFAHIVDYVRVWLKNT